MTVRSSRRQFIQEGLKISFLAGSTLLTGCSSLDRYISGEGGDDLNRVLIFGAGAGGLMAARELKKLGTPFRIYEASPRIGGRVLSLNSFTADGQSLELGAEWFSKRHLTLAKLCKELRIDFSETGAERNLVYRFSDQWTAKSLIQKENSKIRLAFEQVLKNHSRAEVDEMSVEDILLSAKLDKQSLAFAMTESLCRDEFGCSSKNVSALYAIQKWQFFNFNFEHIVADKRLRIRGGANQLLEALSERIVGVVPERFIVYKHKLISIRYNGKYFECLLETNGTEVQVYAKSIICALPIAALRDIDGFDKLPFSDKKKEYLKSAGIGHTCKFGLEYKLSDSLKPLQKTRLFGDSKNQQIWDSTFSEISTPNKNILMTGQLSGEAAKKMGPSEIESSHKEIQKILNQEVELINSQGFNWSLSAYAKGAKSYLSPGQVLGLSDTLEVGEINDQFIFAGEAFSRQFQGTLEGALSSGMLAAQLAQKSYLQNKKFRI